MKQGLIRRIQCFKFNEARSAYVTHLLYAHRQRPSLIIQEINIINPTEQTFDFDFQQKKRTTKSDTKLIEKQNIQFESSKEKFLMTTNQVSIQEHYSIIFVIITNQLIASSQVKPGGYVLKSHFFTLLFIIK
jgi:flagella basal body P-ring formation protein FlgA